jgi:hydroxyacylglutathione hydrolase
MISKDWFATRLVAPRTWAIDDHGSDVIYLVAGDERALLIDTGWGVGDLPALVASLTPLPLLVVNTHGHPDHTFGNGQFERVHIHPAGARMVGQEPPSLESRRWIGHHILHEILPSDFDFEGWATSAAEQLPIQEGHTFDLGGRTLEVISLPGHSPGSICLLDRQARLFLTGDSILSGTIWLHLEESLPLGQFLNHLRRVQGLAGAFDHILPAHGDLSTFPLPKHTLDDLIAGIERVLSGEIIGREEHTFAGDGLRCDFESCGILYRPDRF